MGIRIAIEQFTGILKEIALKIDGNQEYGGEEKGYIDGGEVSVFGDEIEKAVRENKVEEASVKELLGYIRQETTTADTAAVETAEIPYSQDYINVYAAIEAARHEGITKTSEVKEYAKGWLEGKGQRNKNTDRILKGKDRKWYEKLAFKKSGAKMAAQNVKRYNKAEIVSKELKTKDQVLKEIKSERLLQALIDTGLIIKDGEKYNIYPLFEWMTNPELGKGVGSNIMLDLQKTKYAAYREKALIKAELASEHGKGEKASEYPLDGVITAKDVNNLVDLCGIPRERLPWLKALRDATIGAVVTGLNGAAAAASNPQQRAVLTDRNTELVTDVDLKFDFGENAQGSVNTSELKGYGGGDLISSESGAKIGESVVSLAGTVITIVTLIKQPDLIIPMMKAVVGTAWKSTILGAAVGFVHGLNDFGEVPMTNFPDKCSYKDLEVYIRNHDGIKKQAKDALLAVAIAFIDKDGNFDCNGYKDFLKGASGSGSFPNKQELIGALTTAIGKKETKPKTKQEDEKNAYIADETTEKVNESKVQGEADKYWGARKHTWKDLTKMYDCNVTIRMMKVIQAVEGGVYDYDKIKQIADDSTKLTKKQMEEKYKDDKSINIKTLYDVLAAGLIGEDATNAAGKKDTFIVAPKQLTRNGEPFCTRDDSKVTSTTVTAEDKENNNGKQAKTNSKYERTTRTTTTETKYYGTKPGDKQVTEFESEDERTKWEQSLPAGTNIHKVKDKDALEAERAAGLKK